MCSKESKCFSFRMFRSDRESFRVYHRGYMEQAARWPTDPLQVVIASVMKASGSPVVADFGCGEARRVHFPYNF